MIEEGPPCSRLLPERTCIGCRGRKEKSSLIRLALLNDGGRLKVVIDERGSLGGRGAWICRAGTCLEAAVKKHAFNRAFKIGAKVELTNLAGFFLGPAGVEKK